MYPWTSTLTGFGTTNDAIDFDDNEQHITADIGLALQVFYLNHLSQWPAATSSFLGAYWPMLNATCAFWSSRFQPITPPGSTVANYTVKHVMGPDESAGIVDDDGTGQKERYRTSKKKKKAKHPPLAAYTNGAAAALLRFCVQVAPAAGQTVPSIWSAQGARPYLPRTLWRLVFIITPHHAVAPAVNASLYIRPVHSQYTGYAGASIAQAAVALLQYPLGYVFDRQQMIDDLAYYESVTRAGDFFTGDSTYSIAWLALGNATAALKQWAAAFAHMVWGLSGRVCCYNPLTRHHTPSFAGHAQL